MELECAGKLGISDASEDTIKYAFADDTARGEFLILSRSGQEYLQAYGEGDGPFQLEYRDGEEARHFRAKDDLTKEKVKTCFLLYFRGDPAWKSPYDWEPIRNQTQNGPWWKFW